MSGGKIGRFRKLRRKERKKQGRINNGLKHRLFGHLFVAPCCYCRSVFLMEELTIEHLIPFCLGGTNDPSNIALACEPCNKERGRLSWQQKKETDRKCYEQYYHQYRK